MCVIISYHTPSPEEFSEWKEAAANGDPAAQFNLGMAYLHTEESGPVPVDYTEAARWYRQAAEQGLADAQYNLGGAYLFGNGVKEDSSRAFL